MKKKIGRNQHKERVEKRGKNVWNEVVGNGDNQVMGGKVGESKGHVHGHGGIERDT